MFDCCCVWNLIEDFTFTSKYWRHNTLPSIWRASQPYTCGLRTISISLFSFGSLNTFPIWIQVNYNWTKEENTHTHTHTHTHTQMDRRTDRRTDRQMDGWTDRQRETERKKWNWGWLNLMWNGEWVYLHMGTYVLSWYMWLYVVHTYLTWYMAQM